MKKFKIAVSWEVYGDVEIEAETLTEAVNIAENDDNIPLPEPNYIDGSFIVDAEMSKELNGDIEKRVTKRNLMSGKEFTQPANTPLCCDPSSETYWSM